jgi:hypothetical protein
MAGGLTQASDRRLKKHIAPLTYGLDTVMKLKPSSFQMKQGDGATRLGFIAQDVKSVIPELIHEEIQQPGPNAKPDAKAQSRLAMDYIGLVPVLTQSIQELKREQDALKENIAVHGIAAENPPSLSTSKHLSLTEVLLGGVIALQSLLLWVLYRRVRRLEGAS